MSEIGTLPPPSFDQRYSYTLADEAKARDPKQTGLSFVGHQYGAAGANDRYDEGLGTLGLRHHTGIQLAKRVALMGHVMDKRSDGLQSVHLLNMTNRIIENAEVPSVLPAEGIVATDPLSQKTATKIAAGWLHDIVEDHPNKLLTLLGRENEPAKGPLTSILRRLPNTRLTETYLKYKDAKHTRALGLTAISEIWSQETADLVKKVSNPIPLIDTPRVKDWLYRRHLKKTVAKDKDALEIKAYDLDHNAGQNHRTANAEKQLRGDIKYSRAIPPLYKLLARNGLSHLTDLMKTAEAGCKNRIEQYREKHPNGPSVKKIVKMGAKALKGTDLPPPDTGEPKMSDKEVDIAFKSFTDTLNAGDWSLTYVPDDLKIDNQFNRSA